MCEAKELKKQIYEDMRIEEVLENLGMHHIKSHNNGYWICGMPDGDNTSSTVVYNDEKIGVTAYTRTDKNIIDIISLVQYVQSTDFRGALNWLYETLNIPRKYYSSIEKCKIIQPAQTFISRLQKKEEKAEKLGDIKLYGAEVFNKYCYCEYYEKDFEKDNIPINVQKHFGVSQYTDLKYYYPNHYFLIPIADEIGNIAGIKLRCAKAWQYENNKYFYPEPCEKSSILYGLYQTKYYIDQQKEVIICEAEKGVMQLYSYGYKNAVAVGGHSISQVQLEKILKLEVDKIIIAFDQDVKEPVLLTEYKKLSDFVETTCIIDRQHILNEKESPMDNPKKWETLYKECQSIPREFFELEIEEEKEWENIIDDFNF